MSRKSNEKHRARQKKKKSAATHKPKGKGYFRFREMLKKVIDPNTGETDEKAVGALREEFPKDHPYWRTLQCELQANRIEIKNAPTK